MPARRPGQIRDDFTGEPFASGGGMNFEPVTPDSSQRGSGSPRRQFSGRPDASSALRHPGHCVECPYRGYRTDPRYGRIFRVGAYTTYIGRGGALGDVPDDVAATLWPVNEREWIEREGRWDERAKYHFSMLWQSILRDVLQEAYDLRRAAA